MRGARKVNRVGRSDPKGSTNLRIMVRGLKRKRNYLRNNAQQKAPRLVRLIRNTLPVRTGKDLSKSEGTRDQLILPLLHTSVYRCDPFRKLRIILKPINEQY